ncbi:unnamed protein product, partial [Lymnaea stagnalis]
LNENSYKKSCSNGMVAEQDYFLLKGLINITYAIYGRLGEFGIFYTEDFDRYVLIPGTEVRLGKLKTCSDVDRIKIDSCVCTFMDSRYIRLKCNLTAKMMYNR